MRWFFSIIFLLLIGCSDSETSDTNKGESITRLSTDYKYALEPPKYIPAPLYPWEVGQVANLPKISQEFFRCNGSLLNPERMVEKNGKLERVADCGGSDKHSLPLRNEQEFIYPILPELLNYLQVETGKKVVITSGHRCPEHNTYVDSSRENRYSKHMVGAEVSFYIRGMEDKPEKIIQLLIDYYSTAAEPSYYIFERYEKDDTNVSTKPWYNKEVFLKLFKPQEGRNFDNRHPYPYLAIQVRFDQEMQKRVFYNWDHAYKNYLRR